MATTARNSPPNPKSEPSEVPRLRNGDRLTAVEFERRYEAMPHLKKAELIEGVVYIPSPDFYESSENEAAMSSPVSFIHHSAPHFDLITWLGIYRASTPGVQGGDNGTIRLDMDNRPQPDAFLLVLPTHGGQARIRVDDYLEGAPELVAEVAFSSASIDLHPKLKVYRRNGVLEYLVWRIEEDAFDWFVLRDGRYERLSLTPDGYYQSEVFPGLRLDPVALIRGDMAAVVRALQQGLATPEHAAFVEALRQRAIQGPEGGRS